MQPAEDPVAELDNAAQAHFGGWFEEDFPYPWLDLMQEEHFHLAPCARFPTVQTCRYDFGIIDHQRVTGTEILADIGKRIVRHALLGAIHHHETGLIASGHGSLRNQLWRERKIKILQLHGSLYVRQRGR